MTNAAAAMREAHSWSLRKRWVWTRLCMSTTGRWTVGRYHMLMPMLSHLPV